MGETGLTKRGLRERRAAAGRWFWGRLCKIAALAIVLAPEVAVEAAPLFRNDREFTYQREIVDRVPWSIHVARLDLTGTNYILHSTLADGEVRGLNTLSEQIKNLPPQLGKPVAAINGDFYRRDRTAYNGDPKGLQIMRGELVSGPCDWSCFWVDTDGRPQVGKVASRFQVEGPRGESFAFVLNEERPKTGAALYTPVFGPVTGTSGGRELILERNGSDSWLPLRASETYTARIRGIREAGNSPLAPDIMVLSLSKSLLSATSKLQTGDLIRISTETLPSMRDVVTALGGGPALVQDGSPLKPRRFDFRHPRTAVGWNDRYLYLVEVDGRQSGLSVGMSYSELADYMIKLGCSDALNLDGGGSATFWVHGGVVNSPSEGEERDGANGLVILQKSESQ